MSEPISISPVVCQTWGLRGFIEGPVTGGQCNRCSRDVAVPGSVGRRRPVCVYCALDIGLVPAIDVELSIPTSGEEHGR
jgi:hypothetical protein